HHQSTDRSQADAPVDYATAPANCVEHLPPRAGWPHENPLYQRCRGFSRRCPATPESLHHCIARDSYRRAADATTVTPAHPSGAKIANDDTMPRHVTKPVAPVLRST